MTQDICARVHGMSAQGGLHVWANTIYTSCDFFGATIQIDSSTRLVSCHLEDCEFVLPDGVDEVTVYAHSSIFVNIKVRDGRKVKLEHATRS